MKVRICPNCDAHNPPVAWNCAHCGYTLSMNTLVDIDQEEQEIPPHGGTGIDIAKEKEIILFRSEDSFITNHKATISGEVFRIDRITSVEKVSYDVSSLPQGSEGNRRPRPEDILFGLGLGARMIRALTGIEDKRYVLRIHLKNGRIFDYVSKSEKHIDAIRDVLSKVATSEH